jgi:adenine-specific DNA-methyltransferase
MELNKKVSEKVNSIKEDNLKKLAQLFPEIIKDGQVDFKALREELGEFEEVKEEKYQFTWVGKQNANRKLQEDVGARTLKYVTKENENLSENIYIEGDNLEVLKLLYQNYYGSIKMIYIDPPYNTGEDFVYNDTFKISTKENNLLEGYINAENEKLQKNQKTGNKYHATWLNMMYPRLKIAKKLLADDGVMFISIDDREEGNLKKLCDEIFGEENFEKIVWKKKSGAGNTEKILGVLTESIFCVFKDKRIGVTNYRELERKYSYEDKKGKYNLEGIEKTNLGTYERPTMLFGIIDPKTGKEFFPSKDMRWTLGKDTVEKYLREGKLFFDYKNQKVKLIKRECDYEASQNVFLNLLDNHGSLKSAKNYLEEKLKFNRETFDTPKPVELIKQLLEIGSKKDSIILDFFSGSATTAHAVMQLNAEDGGNRKFIMVQLNELTYDGKKEKYIDDNGEERERYIIDKETGYPIVAKDSEARKEGFYTICEIGKERIRRAGELIKKEIEESNRQLQLGEEPKKVPDIGFKVFRTADTNINWKKIKEVSKDNVMKFDDPDMLDFTLGFNDKDVVYEVLLRQRDLPLSEKLVTLTDIGSRTYLYADSYLVCLETNVTEELIEKLAELNPLPIKFIFRDSAFGSKIGLKEETFRKLKTLVEKNSGLTKKAYTVEFI